MTKTPLPIHLVHEWHSSKNSQLAAPKKFTGSRNQKIWWQCSKNPTHEWEAIIANRVRGSGCPYCTNRKTNQENCLQTTHPKLAKEWHISKNIKLRHPKTKELLAPNTITSGSAIRVWWQCDYGHEWEAKICERRGDDKRRGTGCPNCYSQASDAEYRLFAELTSFFLEPDIKHGNKDLGKEADILIESLKLIIELDGSRHHGKENSLNDDQAKTKLFEEKGYTVLRLRGKKLQKLSPYDISFDCKNITLDKVKEVIKWISEKYTQTLDKKIKDELQTYLTVTTFQKDEKYHEIRKALPGKNTLGNFAEQRPDLVAEWHSAKNNNLRPEHFSLKSSKRVWWQCVIDSTHEWEARIYSRANGHGCPYCGNKSVDTNNCLAMINPQLALEWHPTLNGSLTPEYVVCGSNKKIWWQCSKNPSHEWESTVDSRHRARIGCPYCSGKRVCSDNSLFTKNPTLAAEWHPTKNENLMPNDVTSGSKKEAWWLCYKDSSHEWKASIDSRNRGNGCPFCSGRKIHSSNSLATINPQLAAEWHPTKNGSCTPNDFTVGSKKLKIWWLCSKNSAHEWQALILTRSHGHGCPECARKVKSETALKRWKIYRENKGKS